MLEIASGTGQHSAHFAKALPHLRIQPSEYEGLDYSLVGYVREAGLPNLLEPLEIDVATVRWEIYLEIHEEISTQIYA